MMEGQNGKNSCNLTDFYQILHFFTIDNNLLF